MAFNILGLGLLLVAGTGLVSAQQYQQQQDQQAAAASQNGQAASLPASGDQWPAGSGSQDQQPVTPTIKWGRCPQLEPTQQEKVKKAEVITKCLEIVPIPQNITRESIELHREQVAACALQMEGWFAEEGTYRFEKAQVEIKNKKLEPVIEQQVISYHQQCRDEAESRFPKETRQVIAQIQLYQACMDYFISEVCGIEVSIA